ncbi:MAG: DUF4172 domain-containing protein [Enterobacteriaceae bacterium]|jgi:hypothetical protein|nr:DUF4172 domain-containing protein [Enterobacteriaceae bacterium]
MWIWQRDEWANFTYDQSQLLPLLRDVQFLQGKQNPPVVSSVMYPVE